MGQFGDSEVDALIREDHANEWDSLPDAPPLVPALEVRARRLLAALDKNRRGDWYGFEWQETRDARGALRELLGDD